MKCACELEKLNYAINQAGKITGKNLTLPILNSLLLTLEGETLTVRATNLSIGVEIEIKVHGETDGMVAVNGGVLGGVLSNLKKDKEVSLEIQEGNLIVSTKHATVTVKTYNSEDFPTLPRVETDNSYTLPIHKFLEGVKAVSYAAAVSDIKPELASVYIYQEDDQLVFVATDSFRLAEKKVKVPKLHDFPNVLIPVKNLTEIVRIFGDVKEDVAVAIMDNQISFYSDSIYCTARVIDGAFPDYRQIIPTEHQSEVTVLTSDLLAALRMTNIFADKFNQLNIGVDTEEKSLTLRSKKFDVGESNTSIDAKIQGEDMEMSINQKYLSDAFQSISRDSVNFLFKAPNRPLTVKAIGDDTFTYLVMPMNR